ncbi:MAG: hypothetical protein ABEJ34_02470 [Haloferacaceae archaeon]
MYTGRTEQPCCLCGNPETATRIDVPPRAVSLMENAGSIAWRDIVGSVSIHFCADDWETVRDLVLEMGLNPLGRCNAARASFSIREDYEALLNATRDEPDQRGLEERMLDDAERTLDAYAEDPMVEDRDAVEARVIRMALADGDGTDGRAAPGDRGAAGTGDDD